MGSLAFYFEEGVDGGDGVELLVVVEVGKFYDEEELFDADLVLFAVDDDHFAIEGIGDADSCAASGEDVVEEGEVDSVALGLAGGDVGEAVVDVVGTVFLHNSHIVQVALGIGELALLADGDNILDGLRYGEKWCGEDESTCLDGDDVGAMGVRIDVGNQLVECLFVGEKREDVDKVDAGLGKVGVMVDDIGVINHEGLWG